jgi:CubicO group peptidase (beta-lactamase class C family)
MLWKTVLTLVLCSHSVEPKRTDKVCPILGPSFPKPTGVASEQIFRDAASTLDHQLDIALSTGASEFGAGPFNRTTFSIGVFSTNEPGLIYQRHHTDASVANGSIGVRHVNGDTVYRIGSISKLITMYILLLVDGDQSLNRPVTEYIAELATPPKHEVLQNGVLPHWSDISVGDLATHLGGIVSDC